MVTPRTVEGQRHRQDGHRHYRQEGPSTSPSPAGMQGHHMVTQFAVLAVTAAAVGSLPRQSSTSPILQDVSVPPKHWCE